MKGYFFDNLTSSLNAKFKIYGFAESSDTVKSVKHGGALGRSVYH